MARLRWLVWVLVLLPMWVRGQSIQWQDQIGHPRSNNNGSFSYEDYADGIVSFDDRFAVCFSAYAYKDLNFNGHVHRWCYIRYFDYDGRLLKEDTIRGIISDGYAVRATDTTFLVRINYTYLNPTEPISDTGQIGGYMLREYSKSGRLLWQKKFRANTSSTSYLLFARRDRGIISYSDVNMDMQGPDSSYFEFYSNNGQLERAEYISSYYGTGDIGMSLNPDRFLFIKSQRLGSSGPWLYTIAHLDSILRIRRTDTIGLLPANYGNERIKMRPNGGYTVTIGSSVDTIQSRIFHFDHPGRYTRYERIDSGGKNFIPLADGGELAYESKYVTNNAQEFYTLLQQGLPYMRSSYFRRRDANGLPIWSLDINDWQTDSIQYSITPATTIPLSLGDAIFFGRRAVSGRVHSEPWGTFALVGRINGVGQIFDPTSTKPRSIVQASPLSPYPNPATNQFQIDLDKELGYVLLSPTGVVVRQGVAGRAKPVAVGDLAEGLYLLKLEGGRVARVAVRHE